MAELRIDTKSARWYVKAEKPDAVDPDHIWLNVQTGTSSLFGFIPRQQALELASLLAHAAGVDDPVDIPVGEATVSDWSVLEGA